MIMCIEVDIDVMEGNDIIRISFLLDCLEVNYGNDLLPKIHLYS